MDAPPNKEDLKPFIHITKILNSAKVTTPELIAMDIEQGFLLLSDLGDVLLLNELNKETATDYYQQAIDTLLVMQNSSIDAPKIPPFNKAFMLKEMNLFPEWFLKAYLALELKADEGELIQNTMNWLADEVAKQPVVFIHRDYHSRNIMLKQPTSLAVIDYQDAMQGPLTYDLVSLLKDCYISWPGEQVLEWLSYFYDNQPLAKTCSKAEFIRAFDLCGLQRHLKVLGIFSRLYLRDGKSAYLANLPLTLQYVLECTEIYEELHPFFQFLQSRVYLP
jgi:aminoglycoside/choline kinase family phosphotransferase